MAQTAGQRQGYRYITFDDDAGREAALRDPVGFVAELPRRTSLDEVQHVPGLFTAIKAEVDHRDVPGQC